eukprot:129490_1
MSFEIPPAKRRRVDLTSESQSIYSVNSNTNVGFVDKSEDHGSVSVTLNGYNYQSIQRADANKNAIDNKKRRPHSLCIMETREILEHIHSFLDLEEILSSRSVCVEWNEYFSIKILPSSLSETSDCNLFPLYMRHMFIASIGPFENWLLFFISEYINQEFKLKHNIKSPLIYPHYTNYGVLYDNVWHSQYPNKTRFNLITNDADQCKLYEKLLTTFMFERHRATNITLHNILFCWLRGLKPLALYWLQKYDIKNMNTDLQHFHQQLSRDYIEPESGSIPLLQNVNLTKFDYLSSFLGLITMNGDFGLFYELLGKIENTKNKMDKNKYSLVGLFPRQHFPNHVYQHKHTFGFGYNVYGLCRTDLIHIALKICDIPRSVCSLKIIRFVIQPHLLVNIQSDLRLNKYESGNILSVSLNRRIVTLKKLCFYFDLCATIYSSNLNRAMATQFLVYSQLKKPFNNEDEKEKDKERDKEVAHMITNFELWKRYMVLCHLTYFIDKYAHNNRLMFIHSYIGSLFNTKPVEMNDVLWNKLHHLKAKVMVIYPEFENILKDNQISTAEIAQNPHFIEIEQYLKQQFAQYVSAIALLDCIGAIYSNEDSRNSLKVMERRGPITDSSYTIFKQCVLSSQHIRQYFLSNYDLDALYNAIKCVSFHDNDININDDEDRDIGITLKHGDP